MQKGSELMFFSGKKTRVQTKDSKDILELKKQIEASKLAMSSAQNQFEHVIDPTLIDCYIYELNAAQLRYQFLLKSLKNQELLKT